MADAVDWRQGTPLPDGWTDTLPALIAACVRHHGARPVLREADVSVSWQALDAWSGRLAGAWAGRLGPGERIAIIAPNSIAHLLAELACWRLGAIACPVFSGQSTSRIRELLALAAPRLVVAADPRTAATLTGAPVESADGVLALARSAGPRTDRTVRRDDPCLALATSGSTGGAARAAVLTQGNLASQQLAFARLWPEVGAEDRLALYLPWHHSFGALADRLWGLCRGAACTLVPGGGRDRAALLATLRTVRPTVFNSVPILHELVSAAEILDPASLRWVFSAGAPLPQAAEARYAARGIRIHEGWGLTECSPSCTITPPRRPRIPGVVGQPIPGVAVGVRQRDGRILVSGPNVMAGWLTPDGVDGRPVATGVFDTGDLGTWEESGLRLAGRADHLLKLANGESVPAPLLEAQLGAQPGVGHAVVLVDGVLTALLAPTADAGPDALAAAVQAVNAAQAVPYHRFAAAWAARGPLTVESGLLTGSLKVARGSWLADFRAHPLAYRSLAC